MESGSSERSEFTLSSIDFARALVIGPSGVIGDVGRSMGMTLGCSASLAGENSFIYFKEAPHICMDIHMHGFPATFIFFIHMLTQVQALQNTKTDMRDYIIRIKIW